MKTKFCVLAQIVAAIVVTAVAVADELTVTIGRQETVFSDGSQGMHYFPDEPVVVLGTNPWQWFMVDENETVFMQGRTLETSKRERVVLAPGKEGDFDSHYAGICSVYFDEATKRMLAFYHAEKNLRGGEVSQHLTDWSIGLAVSTDSKTFRKKGVIITSSAPRRNMTDVNHGVGDPAICVDKSGEWLYAYYTDLSHFDGRPCSISMARCQISHDGLPGKWQKYHDGHFDQPALGGKDSPVVPRPVPRSDVSLPNVQYVETLGKYIMTLNVLSHEEYEQKSPPKISGIYVTVSDDGIKWNVPQIMLASDVLPIVGKKIAIRAKLHIERSTESTVSGMMIYAFSPSWGWQSPHTPHFMVKREFSIGIKSAP